MLVALSITAPKNRKSLVSTMVAKLSSLLENTFHPMQVFLTALSNSFSDRLWQLVCQGGI